MNDQPTQVYSLVYYLRVYVCDILQWEARASTVMTHTKSRKVSENVLIDDWWTTNEVAEYRVIDRYSWGIKVVGKRFS